MYVVGLQVVERWLRRQRRLRVEKVLRIPAGMEWSVAGVEWVGVAERMGHEGVTKRCVVEGLQSTGELCFCVLFVFCLCFCVFFMCFNGVGRVVCCQGFGSRHGFFPPSFPSIATLCHFSSMMRLCVTILSFPPFILSFPPFLSNPLPGIALGEMEAFHLFELLLQTHQLKQTHYDKQRAEPLYRLQSSSFPLFVHVDAHDVQLPASFNYPFFLEGIKRLLEQEQQIVVTEIPSYLQILKRTLLFVYNFVSLFCQSVRTQVVSFPSLFRSSSMMSFLISFTAFSVIGIPMCVSSSISFFFIPCFEIDDRNSHF